MLLAYWTSFTCRNKRRTVFDILCWDLFVKKKQLKRISWVIWTVWTHIKISEAVFIWKKIKIHFFDWSNEIRCWKFLDPNYCSEFDQILEFISYLFLNNFLFELRTFQHSLLYCYIIIKVLACVTFSYIVSTNVFFFSISSRQKISTSDPSEHLRLMDSFLFLS